MKKTLILAILGFCILGFLIGTIALFKEHSKRIIKYSHLMENGVKTEALVLKKEKIITKKFSPNSRGTFYQFFTHYQAKFSYLHDSIPSDGTISLKDYLPDAPSKIESKSLGVLKSTQMTPKDVFTEIDAGSKISVMYVYGEPETVTILNKDGGLNKPAIIYFAFITLFLLLSSCYILYHYLKHDEVL